MRFSATTLLAVPLFLVGLASGQNCALQVGAWEAYPPETVEGGVIQRRKATVKGFAAVAVNQRTKKAYKSFSLLGNVYFEDMPEGSYKITVRKSGFKTHVLSDDFSCKYARDNIAFVDILLSRGSSNEIEERERPPTVPDVGPDRFTVVGDRDDSQETSARRPIPKQIPGGVLNGKALVFPKPPFPPAARAVRASGAVSVQVLIDESGDVVSASAVSGHPLLRSAAVQAAREAKFAPVVLQGQAVKVSGVITYNFVP